MLHQNAVSMLGIHQTIAETSFNNEDLNFLELEHIVWNKIFHTVKAKIKDNYEKPQVNSV